MSLWELPAAKLFSTLEELQTANVPSDPWNELLYREYVKQKPSYQEIMDVDRTTYPAALKAQQLCVATLVELRTLKRDTPLRYREFARMFDDPASRTPGSAISFMKDKAISGDADASYAILRAAVECPPQKLAALSEAVVEVGLERDGVLRFLALYRSSPDYAERLAQIEQLFPAAPVAEAPPAKSPPPPRAPVVEESLAMPAPSASSAAPPPPPAAPAGALPPPPASPSGSLPPPRTAPSGALPAPGAASSGAVPPRPVASSGALPRTPAAPSGGLPPAPDSLPPASGASSGALPSPSGTPAGSRPAAQARPQSKVSQMQGPGYMAVLRPDGQIEGLRVEAERVSQMPAGYTYSTTMEEGQSRRIVNCQISDCLNLVALYCEDDSVDLIDRASGEMLARLPKGFTAFTRAPDGSLLLGGSFGLYVARGGADAEPLAQHQIQALCGSVRVLAGGEMWVGNQPRFEVDNSRRLRISPDGNWLAQWNAAGEVEIYEVVSGRSRAYFATRLEELDLSFSEDSKRLVTTATVGMMVWSLAGTPVPELCPPKLVGDRRSTPR